MSVKKPAVKKPATPKSAPATSPPAKPPAKAAANQPANQPAAQGAAAGADLHTSAYVLPALLARAAVGTAITAEQVLLYVDAPQDQLVATGQEVRTERINLDAARLYGTAYDFFQSATAEQRAAVPGLTTQRLRVSIWAAAQGEAKNQAAQLAEERSAAAQGYRATDAKQIRAQALGARDVLHATLFALVAGNKLRVDELRDACGRSEKPKEIARSLVALADQHDHYLSSREPKLVARCTDMQLDGSLGRQARALAEQVLLRGSVENAPRTATSNAEVDLWDGINLHLLEQLVTIFEAGHRANATVPRLLPLSLRSWFGTYKSPKQPSAPAPSQPAD